jgi:hypothetical protein
MYLATGLADSMTRTPNGLLHLFLKSKALVSRKAFPGKRREKVCEELLEMIIEERMVREMLRFMPLLSGMEKFQNGVREV